MVVADVYAVMMNPSVFGSDGPRLTDQEAAELFEFVFKIHDHTAARPSVAVY